MLSRTVLSLSVHLEGEGREVGGLRASHQGDGAVTGRQAACAYCVSNSYILLPTSLFPAV